MTNSKFHHTGEIGMKEILLIAVLVLLAAAAVFYIIRAKRNGKACIGCPDGGTCGGQCKSCPSQKKH